MKNIRIKDVLNGLSEKYKQKYGVAVFSINIETKKEGVEVTGGVLVGNQKEEVLESIRKKKIRIIKEKIEVLSDPEERNEIGWGTVRSKIADLRSRFVSNEIMNEKILKRIRCSQVPKGEILRILHKNEDQLLVQKSDLTLGWIDKKEVISKKENLYNKWKNDSMIPPNVAIKCARPVETVAEEAEKFLGTVYALGGVSKEGIDCSALVQAAYKNALNIVLPKHSWDQKRFGKIVGLKEIKTGDLIFLKKKKNSHKHVGIVFRKDLMIYLIHASLDAKKVVKEFLEKVFEDYDFIEARRIVEE